MSGAQVEIKADLVILATGLVAQKDAPSLPGEPNLFLI